MEMTTNFNELTFEELENVDGGKITPYGLWNAACGAAASGAVGCIAASFVPGGGAAYMTAIVVSGVTYYIWQNA